MCDREGRNYLHQVQESFHEQQRKQKRDMVVAKEDVFQAQLEVLGDLLAHRHAVTGVVKIIRLERREDDLVLAVVPREHAQDGMRGAELLEDIERQRDVPWRGEHGIPKHKAEQALAVIRLRDDGARSFGPDGWKGPRRIRLHADSG